MAYLMTVFYKNYLHSDFDIKRHKNIFILPVYLHLLPVCNHYARAAVSDVTVTSTLNWSIGCILNVRYSSNNILVPSRLVNEDAAYISS